MKFWSSFYLSHICVLCAALSLNSSWADQPLADAEQSGWQISLGLGAGIRTNPVMDNSDIPLIVIPLISYQGERFFIQNLDIGYTFWQTQEQQLSFLITPSYDQVFFNDWDINNFVVETKNLTSVTNAINPVPTVDQVNRTIVKQKLHKRHVAMLSGFEYTAQLQDWDLQLQALHEMSNYYNGDELHFAISKNINIGKNDVKLTLGANWQSNKTIQYFYGLHEHEALGSDPYWPTSGITTLMRFDWNYQLNQHWSLRFFTSYRHLSSPIIHSPLVTDNNVITAFAGGVYHF